MKMILGKKLLMTRIFDERGREIPVTLIKTEPQKSGEISKTVFVQDDIVSVTATSKGKGFAGTVKRHHFHLGPKTHGSDNYRRPGSIGDTGPQRVVKGKKMAGHLGHRQTTIKNRKIILSNADKGELLIAGPIPGPNKGLVKIWSKNEA